MYIRKRYILAAISVFCVLVMTGCKEKEMNRPSDNEKKEIGNIQEDSQIKQTYSFVDVLGEKHEAPLLEEVPKCSYDLSRLTRQNGFVYYTDREGNILSKVGIDVSEYQTGIDWTQVKHAGVDFVMIRLGYRGYGEAGTLVLDPMFREHMDGALNAGLEVGVYFFSQAVTDDEVREEAGFVLEHIKDYPITYPVVFDTEEIKFDTARTDHLSNEQFTRNCILFCDQIKAAGYDTMIYANMKWFAFKLDLTKLVDYKKWYADYEPVPQSPYAYAMWQYSETGKVPGIEGNVDLNIWFPQEQ